MNQKRNKNRIGFLLLILLLVAMTGCGKKETPTTTAMKQETTKEETNKKETTVSSGKTESKEKYSVEEVAQDIEFDGKKISLPTTLKELGDEYCWYDDLEPMPLRRGVNYYAQNIRYKDASMNKGEDIFIFVGVGTVQLNNPNVLDENSIICGLLVTETELNMDKFSIKGIKIGDSLKQVRDVFGTEDYTKNEGKFIYYSYGKESENHIDFMFRKDDVNKMYGIRIIYEK